MHNVAIQNEKSETKINSAYVISVSDPDTAFSVFDLVHGAVAVEVFANYQTGTYVCSDVQVEDVRDCPGEKRVSVTLKPLKALSRLITHACNLAPHAAFFLMHNDKASLADFYDYLLDEDHLAFEVDLCGNSVEFRRAARLALNVMSKNHNLWREKADDAWTYWAKRLGFDPDDLSFLDPDPDNCAGGVQSAAIDLHAVNGTTV